MYINSTNMDTVNNQQDDAERRKISEVKEKISEKKRTDSRNEQLNYHRKRMIQPVQIRQLSQEDVNLDDVFEEENVDFINEKINDFKIKIINPSSEEDLWKALLIFETMTKKIQSVNIKSVIASDLTFVRNLLQLTQNSKLSEECKLGALQMLSEVTESFKNLSDIDQQADQQAFESYLRVYRSTKNEKTFATVLQGVSQLSLDNVKASEYFIQNGLYNEILNSFENMLKNANQYAESIKDICIILHGLSKQKIPFDYNHTKLGLVFEYLVFTNDCDIHFDVSSAIENIVSSYTNNENLDWVQQKLQQLYNLGLMKVILKLINQDNVWIPVKGNKIIDAISHIENPQIRQAFMLQIHDSGIFDQIISSIKSQTIKLVIKYHLFKAMKNLVERGCICSEKYNYLIQNLMEPVVTEKTQQQVIDIIWEILQKEKENFKIEITKPLIEILCSVLKESTDVDLNKKCLDVFDKVMQISAQDINQKKHKKWLQSKGFNDIIHNLQQNKNDDISKKAVSVISHLDSDEDSDSDSMDEEFQD